MKGGVASFVGWEEDNFSMAYRQVMGELHEEEI